ncbi:MAG TPA: DUF262 domain-containing protein [Ktedonobacterales bacterium]|nr:DUF262 domain-containing protein [Ktedonobacterales bacterium]
MKDIQGEAKNVRKLLEGEKYSIDYYQREYKWGEKQIRELIEDLTQAFLEEHDPTHERRAVMGYGHYFLGSIIISSKDNLRFIVDGQQRLTSLTLLLIYLHNLQREMKAASSVEKMIFSEQFGEKTFNLHVDERIPCMEALFEQQLFDDIGQTESVQNILARYRDIETCFPVELTKESLPYFADWLKENVHLVEITAYSDDDAYTIFETMNDRGLSLSPVDMLKGYLLANISDPEKRDAANVLWKRRVAELAEVGKDVDADFFKAWLRGQFAESIRERRKGAKPEDFDRIGTEFHRWVKDNQKRLQLNGSASFVRFLESDFNFYSRQYLRLMEAAAHLTPGLEHVFYNAQLGFTSQYQVLLAPLVPGDSDDVVARKFRLVARYLDILLNRRIWNWHSIGFSTMQYAMFLLLREIRRKPVAELARLLHARLSAPGEQTFTTNARFYMHVLNRENIRLMLARMTDYLECASGMTSRYVEYVTAAGVKRYEVEHIWANKFERHTDEFSHPQDFAEYRNRIGDLLLLPKSFNASYGALPYEEKVTHYDSQNLLARSLNALAYDHNPGFLRFIQQSGLDFKPFAHFVKADLDARQALYTQLAERVWDPAQLLQEVAE